MTLSSSSLQLMSLYNSFFSHMLFFPLKLTNHKKQSTDKTVIVCHYILYRILIKYVLLSVNLPKAYFVSFVLFKKY